MLSRIRALLFFLYIFLTIPIVIVLIKLFQKRSKEIRRFCAAGFIKLFGFKYEIEGVVDREVKMIVMNHLSFLDIIFMEYFHPGDLCFVAKKELGEIFLLGHGLKVPKMILVDRDDKRSIISLIKDAKDRIDNNRVIALFPEGTRGDGEGLLEFKSGAKMIAQKFNLKIQPALFIGTKSAMDIKNFKIDATPFKVVFMNSVTTESKTWYEDLRDEMERVYIAKRSDTISNR